ncbi:MAG: hypothetical protein LKK19_06770, partial [Bacteroidales bacterium]|jgi:hypothetical protein|nr:hypothetical protein [Bacteroidales bacterium]
MTVTPTSSSVFSIAGIMPEPVSHIFVSFCYKYKKINHRAGQIYFSSESKQKCYKKIIDSIFVVRKAFGQNY